MKGKKARVPISVLLCLCLIISVFGTIASPSAFAQSASSDISNTLDAGVTEWLLDEDRGYIYAVSGDTNSLMYIRMSDLQVEATVPLGGSKPSDIRQYNNKLYIPLSGGTLIAIVDIGQRKVEKTLATTFSPFRVAVTGGKLYYAEYDQWCRVMEYDLSTNVETPISDGYDRTFYNPDLAVDSVNHVLYIGESGSSGSNLFAFSTIDRRLLSKSTYDDGYGFGYPSRKVIFDGQNVYYAGRKFDKSNLSSFSGAYGGNVVAVKHPYVLTYYSSNTPSSVYERLFSNKIADLPVSSSKLLIDSQNQIYAYTGPDFLNSYAPKKIHKLSVDLTIQSPISYQTNANKLTFTPSITDWVYSASGDYIYAISKDSSSLLYIRTSDFKVERTIITGYGHNTIDIDQDNKLYIGSAATQMTVVNTVNHSVYSWELGTGVNQLKVADHKAYFTKDTGSFKALYTLNLADGSQTSKSFSDSYNIRLLPDASNGLLYFGETGTSGGNLVKLRLSDLSVLDSTYGYGYSYPSGDLVKDDGYIYYARKRLNASVINTVYGEYASPVIYARGPHVFTSGAVYDRDTFVKAYDLPVTAKKVSILPDGSVIVLSSDGTMMLKYASMDELRASSPDFSAPTQTATYVSFYDTDYSKGNIGGTLYWFAPSTTYITGYTIYFLDANNQKVGLMLGEVQSAVTGNHSFTIPAGTAIPEGALKLGVYAKNGYGESENAAAITIVDSDWDGDIVKKAVISGKITNGSIALSNVNVFASSITGSFQTYTDAQGNYSIDVPYGTYTVFTYFNGSTTTIGRNITLAETDNKITLNGLLDVVAVTGTVMQNDQPGSGASVTLFSSQLGYSAITGEDGTYSLYAKPGTYTFRAETPNSVGILVKTVAGPQTVADIPMDTGGFINVSVPSGYCDNGLLMRVLDRAGHLAGIPYPVIDGVEGSCSFKIIVPAGTYTVQMISNSANLQMQKSVEVASGQTVPVQFDLPTTGITGTITPLDHDVFAMLRYLEIYNDSYRAIAPVSGDGTYTAMVPPGIYSIAYYDPVYSAMRGKMLMAVAHNVQVREGVVSKADLTMTAGGMAVGILKNKFTGLGVEAQLQVIDASGNVVSKSTSSSDGRFYLIAPPGTYSVNILTPRYTQTVPNVTLAADRLVELGEVQLSLTGITGKLVSDGSQPVVGARIVALIESGIAGVAMTAYDGSYSLSLPVGVYTIKAEQGEGVAFQEQVTVKPDESPVLLLQLSSGGTINGKLSNADGAQTYDFDRAIVIVRNSADSIVDQVSPGSDGTYTVRIPAGSYTTEFSMGDWYGEQSGISVTAGSNATVNAAVSVTRIAGKVTEADGAIVMGAQVTAYNAEGVAVNKALSRSDGSFTLFVPAGKYNVKASQSNRSGQIIDIAAVKGTMVSANLVMSQSGTVTGKVTTASGNEAVPGLWATVQDSGGKTVDSVISDTSGFYKLVLPPGTYTIVSRVKDGTAQQQISVTVKAGQETKQDLQLSVAKITGVVTTSAGQPLNSAIVSAIYQADGTSLMERTPTNSDGSYTLFVPAGRYAVHAILDRLVGTASDVQLSAGEMTEKNISVDSGGMVSGTVTNSASAIGGAAVIVTGQDGTILWRTKTNSLGKYDAALPPGTYVLKISAAGYQDSRSTVILAAGQTQKNNIVMSVPSPVTQPSNPGGGGIIGGGGGVANASPPSQTNAEGIKEIKLDTEKDGIVTQEKNAAGQPVTTVTIHQEKLTAALQSLKGAEKATNIISIQVKGTGSAVKAVFPAQSILEAVDSNIDAMLAIQSDAGTYRLPIQVLRDAILKLGAEGKQAHIAVLIAPLSPDLNQAIMRSNEGTTPLLTHPIEFMVTVETSDGRKQEIQDFAGTYVERTVVLDNLSVPVDRLAAVQFDPASGKLSFVPFVLANQGGVNKITIKSPHNSIYTVVRTDKSFPDIGNHWAQQEIQLLASKLILDGVTSTEFRPDESVTRAQFASILVRSLGLTEKTNEASRFTDVNDDDWFKGSVGAAVSAGLVEGTSELQFQPNDRITREQMAVMMGRALKFTGKEELAVNPSADPLSQFNDRMMISAWAHEAAGRLVQAGIMEGNADAAFDPAQNATRAQTAVMLKRFLQYVQFIN